MSNTKKNISSNKFCDLMIKVADFQTNLATDEMRGEFCSQAIAIEYLASKGLIPNNILTKFIELIGKNLAKVKKGKVSRAVSEFDEEVMDYLRKLFTATKKHFYASLKKEEHKKLFQRVVDNLDPENTLLLTPENNRPSPLASIFTAFAIGEIALVEDELERSKGKEAKRRIEAIPFVVRGSFTTFIDNFRDV